MVCSNYIHFSCLERKIDSIDPLDLKTPPQKILVAFGLSSGRRSQSMHAHMHASTHYKVRIVTPGCLSVYLQFTLKVRPTNPYIHRISVTRGMSQAYLYDHNSFCNGTLARKKNGATGLKLQHADTTWLCKYYVVDPIRPPFFPLCVRLKMSKMVLLKQKTKKKLFDLITRSLLY